MGPTPGAGGQYRHDTLSYLPSPPHGPHLEGQWTPMLARCLVCGCQHPKPHLYKLNSKPPRPQILGRDCSYRCCQSLLEDQVQKVSETTQMRAGLTSEEYPLLHHRSSPLASSEWHYYPKIDFFIKV